MPNYNNAPFLKEAIDSILNQTFTNFHFLIVDDGSTDNSVDIIKQYNDPRITLIQKEKNSGIVDTLNIGLERIESTYIVRMDGDDISTPDRLMILYNFMEENPEIGVCGSQIMHFGNENIRTNYYLEKDKIKSQLIFNNPVGHATAIIRTKLIHQHHFSYRNKYPYMEDYDLFLRMKNQTVFANIDRVLYYYRLLNHNSTLKNKDTLFQRKKNIFSDVLSELQIPATEENLTKHLEFFVSSSISFPIRDYRRWIDYLIQQNQKNAIYPHHAFIELLEEKWTHFFFKVSALPIGKSFTYFFISKKIRANHLLYLLKCKINRWKNKDKT